LKSDYFRPIELDSTIGDFIIVEEEKEDVLIFAYFSSIFG
jgi:hypothetical protein